MDLNRFQPQSQFQLDPSPYKKQRVPLSRQWSATKNALNILSVAFCVIILGIAIELSVNPSVQSYIAVWTAPQAGVALLWSAGTLITTYTARRDGRDIHPGAQVAVQLILWLGFSVGVGLTAYILKFALEFAGFEDRHAHPQLHDYYYPHNDGYEYYSGYYIHSMEAIITFLSLLVIVHLSLFACACVETIKQRRTNNIPSFEMSSENTGHIKQ
ncbi:uncharacterized protein F4822DRAFT_87170 [Hypoxylon trugodes]|uniref:uncharacterized protein n=1 Tax=Hypoxylon trugodes TaxID=326681 RepID=UPI00219C92DE|nr:uncharacterized protein F4822DRAFT_87170 [Hypoxylon trugodes]KAI1382940.1 hypothetical protein F4822DRAFT_87170 [Hypoxylon trugodes]